MKHFQKTPEGKYLPTDATGWLIAIAVIIGFFAIIWVPISLGIKHDEMEAQQKAQQTLNEQTGTYSFTDNAGNIFHLTLKTDETCTLQQKGSDHVYYGSWREDLFTEGELITNFDFDMDDTPTIVWPDGEEYGMIPTIKDGYIYSDMSSADAKNPRKRLPCSK